MESPTTIVVIVMLSLFSVMGTIGNALVLYIYTKKRDRTTSSIFILTLAGCDLITCAVIMPFTIAVLYTDYKLDYDVFCKLYMFLITCNVPFSAFIMVAIAFDRYFCICHPFLHAMNVPRAKVIVFCLLVLAFTLGIITASSYAVVSTFVTGTSNTSDIFCENSTDSISISANCSNTQQKNVTESDSMHYLADIGVCLPNTLYNPMFLQVYQKVYASFYLLSFLIVLILYGLIYRAIHVRRAKKAKRKKSALFPTSANTEISCAETQLTALNGNGECVEMNNAPTKKPRTSNSIKDKTFYANIRTAAMLFIVAIVFLIAFLPAWLMAHRAIGYIDIIFYMYYIYNVANPVIYAFMNKSFRDDLKFVFSRVCRG